MASKKDNRIFKRFKCDSEIVLYFKDSEIKAQTTDYSLKGIGFSLKEGFSISKGSSIRFKLKELGIEDKGKIVWTRDLKSLIRGGIERETISGDLKNYPFADVILDIKKSSKTGILIIKNPPTLKKLFILDGDIIFASSNKKEDSFIESLLRNRKINIDQYYQISEISKKTGKSHGSILLELNILKPEEVIKSVKSNIEDIIIDIFKWNYGKFIFYEGPIIDKNVVSLNLSSANIIYRGVKKINTFSVIKKAIPSLDTILYYSDDPYYLFQNINLSPQDKEIFDLIDGKKSIKEILSLSPINEMQTLKTLYAFLSTRIVEYHIQDTSKDTYHEEVLKEEETIDKDFINKVESLYELLNSYDYYNILGIDRWATQEEIKKAFYKVAKEFHPDKHYYLPTEDMKSKLNTIFSYITEAYKTLSNPDLRMKYDKDITKKSEISVTNNKELAELRCSEGDREFSKGNYDKAEELYSQAVYLNNTISEYHYKLGLTLYKKKKFHEAGKYFSQASKLDPENPIYLSELGHTFIELGYKLRAKSTFEKALSLKPNYSRAIEGLQRIK